MRFYQQGLLTLSLGISLASLAAQEAIEFQKPSEVILKLADYQSPPSVWLSQKKQVVYLYSSTYSSLEDLSQDEMRLGGLRLNPKYYIASTTKYYERLELQQPGGKPLEVKGLPKNPKLCQFKFSPDERYMAFLHQAEQGLELWVLDLDKGQARRLCAQPINAVMEPYVWQPDSKGLLVALRPKNMPALIDPAKVLPTGPVVTVSRGEKSQNRTYQDLLKNRNDEHNFDILCTSEIQRLDLQGKLQSYLPKGLYLELSFSPDGQYLLTSSLERPYSYLVPYSRFPMKERVHQASTGKLLKVVNEQPLLETLPKGFMAVQTGKRGLGWRADKAAELYFVQALDGGDPKAEVAFRDEVFLWTAPFKDEPRSLVKTKLRFGGLTWGDDQTAYLREYWYDTRQERQLLIAPGQAGTEPKLIVERNYQDLYGDPGSFLTEKNNYKRYVLLQRGGKLYRQGEGMSAEGQAAFLDEFNPQDLSTKRLYQVSDPDKFEEISKVFDIEKGEIILRIQSPTDYPNYYSYNFKTGANSLQQLSQVANPFEGMGKVHKEILKYKRQDGVELSGTLYLPPGYDTSRKEPLPLLIWAYPREYKDKASAGQVTANAKRFTFPYYGSFVYWAMKGYAVLDNAAFPIVGEGDTEPNDKFIEQLIANAEAAIQAVTSRGFADPKRVGIGGHSYGAFMTANLLTHSKLFACGIARSGAYNRTLTPFGFQSEQRNYWEAMPVYQAMSPFTHADKMKTPLLLVHGEADNNPGTFTLQTERYFQALKGFGAPARMVILPKESHGYKAKENILHLLWEQERFLDEHLKPSNSSGK